ncbi:hypothetical protein C8Q77DRAFT_380022 [Trametes polyzona]|nr:hypothetical protein C8Q77DRAFT_380022 [Trametes polyzona]
MVFARMTPADKDAFFALLDEYFASRPDLFNGSGSGDGGAAAAAGKAVAASAVSHAFSQAASRASNGPGAPPVTNGWSRPDAATTAEIGNSVGRVAAAAAALKLNAAEQTPSGNGAFPRPPPRRMNTGSSNEEPAAPPPEHNKLLPTRKFGDVDMSSTKNMFSSLRHSTAAKHATPAQVAPPTPPAFQRKNDFAPPPRRVPSTGSSRSSVAAPSSPAPPPVPRRAQQEEESGEWAEAMYDYHSEDPGDLDLQEGVRVLIVEKTSDDWWTGEIDGQRGLVPAAYVKLL